MDERRVMEEGKVRRGAGWGNFRWKDIRSFPSLDGRFLTSEKQIKG